MTAEIKIKKYLGKANLKGSGVSLPYSPEQMLEIAKCSEDCSYFIRTYVKIIHPDHGIVPFIPYGYQEEMIKTVVENRFTICKIPRQQGKSTIVAAILLWHVLFHEHFKVALLAHKAAQAREILSRIQLAYENLPYWLQQGIKEWNKGSIELENGSVIEAEATSAGSIRGRTYNIVYCDELAHVELSEQEDFFTSTYPTITSGKTTKLVITSTPKGMEYFYKIWKESEEGKNSYKRVEAFWWDVPGRDEEWKKETISNTSERQFEQEFECSFLGSMSTLIDGKKIGVIPTVDPIARLENNFLWIYEAAQKNRKYVMCVDTSHGVELDYSAFVVIDATELPYRTVARYKSNEIPSIFYPEVVYRVAKTYNNAFILVESNDVGGQVANTLYRDLEYENMFVTQNKPSKGQEAGGGWGTGITIGLRMTPASKRIGCMSIKTVIEMDRLIINDFGIKQEMTTFVADNKKSYSAEKGKHDDLMMCLVMFGWLVHQPYFKELTEVDIRRDLIQENTSLVNEDLTPFGFIDNGDEMNGSYLDDDDFMKHF